MNLYNGFTTVHNMTIYFALNIFDDMRNYFKHPVTREIFIYMHK